MPAFSSVVSVLHLMKL